MVQLTDPRSSHEDLRRRLLNAAVELLQEPDTPLDLRKVAERAGKSRTAPYLVFGKESEGGGVLALRIAVAAHGAHIMSHVMADAVLDVDDPIEGFHAVAAAFLSFVEHNPRLFRLMYGPEINAITRLGEDGFRDHPEFRLLLKYRDRAGEVVADLIRRAQERDLLPADPVRSDSIPAAGDFGELPSVRYLQIAWATMIGVSVLREDDLLKAIGWDIGLEDGARLVAEAVLGLDPEAVESAVTTFLRSRGVEGPEMQPAAPPPSSERTVGDVSRALRARQPHTPAAREQPAPPSPRPEPGPPTGNVSLTNMLDSYPGLRRAAYGKHLLEGAHILWIDDHPNWIESEARTLEHLGARVTRVLSTEAALAAIPSLLRASWRPLRVIISDIGRGDRKNAGIQAIPKLQAAAPGVPVIFFIANLDPSRGVPAGAAGITNRTDELLHLVLDALERR